MKYAKFIPNKMDEMSWWIPASFAFSCGLLVTAIALLILRGFDGMDPRWTFSIGADIFCLAISVMLCFSCLLSRRSSNEQAKSFVVMLTMISFALFLDEASWLVQGKPALRLVNVTVNVLFYMNGIVLINQFWRYIRKALKMDNHLMKVADNVLTALFIPSLLLCAVNFFYPLYFSVSSAGEYARADKWYVSQIYLCMALFIVILELFFSKAPRRDRWVAASFAAIPLVNQLLTGVTFGLSTQYAAMLVSVVLIYGVVFADRENTISATETELGVATRIQADMLPNTFPFMPERTEFDLYASMDPAKEVGGDFYDFFMVDDDRLALVIADVSGKGIPAALFMMSSKILIKNSVMTGKSPGEVLKIVNNQICENNREEMFVTVWLGILDLTSGQLVSANAGHEYPVLKTPDGDFEILKSKHSFVVGGMQGLKYRETEMTLLPGSKLFVYTDGVPEAEAEGEVQYGYDRFLDTLNSHRDENPEGLLKAVTKNVADFVQDHPQFDDLTMLCIHYIGKESEVNHEERTDD